MCGIAGLNWEDRERIEAMAAGLVHRGPDQEGFFIGEGVSLGHKRLSILDLSEHGRQPMTGEDGQVVVVYNGEIFNFESLRRDLEDFGHRFVSHSDTEVLVHGYEQWGRGILERLNGQFAFCIWDRRQRLFFLARDRFGIKPLYYWYDGRRFAFGSELKTILTAGARRDLDSESLNQYWYFGYMPTGRTIFKGICQLPPASFLIFDLEKGLIQTSGSYWRLSFDKKEFSSEQEAADLLADKLHESVRMQMVSDVPVGAFLSGGLDSSILTALMRRHTDKLKTFSIRFDHPDFNESHYAQAVSRFFQTEHYEIQFDARHVLELMERLPVHYDEPFADPSMIPTWLVCSVASRQVKVSLSGTGGDELFAGYPRYRQFLWLKRLNRLPKTARRLLDAAASGVGRFSRNDQWNKLRCFLQERLPDSVLYPMLLSFMFRTPHEAAQAHCDFGRTAALFATGQELENLLAYDLLEYVPNGLLVKEDRASMAFGLEVRVPFLDHSFVEFACGLKPEWKLRHGCSKYLLKKAFSTLLPPVVIRRKKQGFGVPLVHYFRKELKSAAEDILFSSSPADSFYERTHLEELWRLHQSGRADYSRILWAAMMFILWHRRWMP